MRRLLAGLVLVGLVITCAAGCRPQAQAMVLMVEADPQVSWEGRYLVWYRNGPASTWLSGSSGGSAVSGSGNSEVIIPTDEGRIVGVFVSLARKTEGGAFVVRLLQGGKVLAEDVAGYPTDGVGFTWGTDR